MGLAHGMKVAYVSVEKQLRSPPEGTVWTSREVPSKWIRVVVTGDTVLGADNEEGIVMLPSAGFFSEYHLRYAIRGPILLMGETAYEVHVRGLCVGHLKVDLEGCVMEAHLADNYRGLGMGRALYEFALRDRGELTTEFAGDSPSPSAKRVWDSLVKRHPHVKAKRGKLLTVRVK